MPIMVCAVACVAVAGCDGDTPRGHNTPEPDGASDVVVNPPFADRQPAADTDDVEPRDCRALRVSIDWDAAAPCEFPIREPISSPSDLQVMLLTDSGTRYLQRTEATDCGDERWFYDSGVVTLCAGACQLLRDAGLGALDVRVYCPPPPPNR